jgi:hypothetical protein
MGTGISTERLCELGKTKVYVVVSVNQLSNISNVNYTDDIETTAVFFDYNDALNFKGDRKYLIIKESYIKRY